MALMVVDTVYKTLAGLNQTDAPGSLTITGGTVNIYFANTEAQPANAAAMTLDSASPASGVVEILPAARWILYAVASGAPVVNEFRVARVAPLP